MLKINSQHFLGCVTNQFKTARSVITLPENNNLVGQDV